MPDYILFMHGDVSSQLSPELWETYLAGLRARGAFQGGSEIGLGEVVRKGGAAPAITRHLTGYIRVEAKDLEAAKALAAGNPVFEAGGSIEIRELPKS